MDTKYICGELPAAVGTCYGGIVFPGFMTHADVARHLGVVATSAGFCYVGARGIGVCYGKSVSLNVESKESDAEQLNRLGR